MTIEGFEYLHEDEAPEYKARMQVVNNDDPKWDVLIFRGPGGTLEATIITELGNEMFGDYKPEYVKDVRVACIGEYTFRRNADHTKGG